MSTAKDSPAPAMENVHAALSASTDTPTPQPGGLVDARTDTPSATPDETHGEALDAAWRDEILALLERGLRPREAAAWCGMTCAQLKETVRRDPVFAKRFHRARLSVKLKHLDNIHDIREGNGWRVSAWYLASAYPDEFARPGGRRPGSPRAPRQSEKEAQIEALKAFPPKHKSYQEFERIGMRPAPPDEAREGGPAPEAPEVAKANGAEELAAPAPDAPDARDEPYYGPEVPPPADLPVLEHAGDAPVPPPNCLVVDGAVIEDGAAAGVETIFADYDAALYADVGEEIGPELVPALQRHPVRRAGAYFEGKSTLKRTVGRRELMRRFGTLNVQRYIWTGVTFEQSFPVQGGAPP